MRILGIKIRQMDSMIKKNLHTGWYPFGDYSEPSDGAYVPLDEKEEERRNEISKLLYPILGEKSPKVTISCIAGKNGSGKSSLLDILFRIINNVAYRYLIENDAANVEYAFGVYADMHFEINGILGCVTCANEETKVYWGSTDDGGCKELNDNDCEDYKMLSKFFYTISINYSMYAYNCQDYTPKDNRISRVAKGINGKWLEHVFHKNDGYLTPIVLAPFRDKNGNIDVMREKKLALQRLTSLILLFKSQDQQFIPGYEPSRLYWRYDEKYLNESKNKLQRSTGLSKLKFDRYLDYYRGAWKRFFTKVEIDIESLQVEGVEDIGKVCLSYLAYKTFKICITYPGYVALSKSKPLKYMVFDTIVSSLVENIDHISVKIHQCLFFMTSNLYKKASGSIGASDITSSLSADTSYNNMMVVLPPSFFNYDLDMAKAHKGLKIKSVSDVFPYAFPVQFGFADNFSLDSMSSGERQFLHSISYALYHIKNIESVRSGVNRVHYDHINLILDEAELYYHPEYQRRYVQMLLESMSWCKFKNIKSINIVIVTHSPFILSDMVQDNILYLENGERKIVEGYTFGANYYDLLYNSFFFEKNAIGEVATRVITDMIQHPDNYKNKKWMLDILADPIIRGHLLNKMNEDV